MKRIKKTARAVTPYAITLYGDDPQWRQRLEDRFWEKVDKSGEGCWLWTAATNGKGYGRIGLEGPRRENVYAHRAAWWLATGEWPPDDRQVCHECDCPSCCRPDHLFLGTASDNLSDAASKGRCGPQRHPDRYKNVIERIASARRERSQCIRGHELTPKNTRVTRAENGWVTRSCRTCEREAAAARKREAPAKTHCRNGHELTPENTVMMRTRWNGECRTCLLCRVEAGRNHYKNGTDNVPRKLTDEQARSVYCDQRSSRMIGREYGVSYSVVLNIKSGIAYPYIHAEAVAAGRAHIKNPRKRAA